MKTNQSIACILSSAVALALLLGAANATALTNHPSANAAANIAKALPAPVHLTPAATVASPAASAGEDIRDIRQPRHVPVPLLWILVAAGVAATIGALVCWRLLRRAAILELTPRERALELLEESRHFMNPEHAREYCFAVSQIIRGYLEEELHLRAPRLTTEEFLRELVEGQNQIAGSQHALLGDFLEHCDLAKFGGWRYPLAALADMHDTAVRFVQECFEAMATTPMAGDPASTVTESVLLKQE